MGFLRVHLVAPAFVFLIVIAGPINQGHVYDGDIENYRVFVRPDGAYRVVVLRRPQPTAMPGQASDAPGLVQLLNRQGQVMNQTDVEMVQLVEAVDWSDDGVHIKLVVDWSLPDQPPQ